MKISLTIISLLAALAAPAYALKIDSESLGIHLDTQKLLYLTGPVSESMYVSAVRQMLYTSTTPGDRIVIFNSQGGLEAPGARIIELMEAEKLLKVRQICIVQQAQSMAFNILTHCDVRVATRDAAIMAHVLALEEIDCTHAPRCTPTYLTGLARELKRDDAPYREVNAKALGLTPKEYDVYAAKDYRWSPIELLDRHFLSGIIKVKK